MLPFDEEQHLNKSPLSEETLLSGQFWGELRVFLAVAKTKLPSPSEEPVKKRKITSKTISKTELGSDEDIATPWKVSHFCMVMSTS